MATPEQLGHIKERLDSGMSRDQLRTVLHEEGWTDEKIEEAFSELDASASSVATSMPDMGTPMPSKGLSLPSGKVLALIATVSLLAVGAVAAMVWGGGTKEVENRPTPEVIPSPSASPAFEDADQSDADSDGLLLKDEATYGADPTRPDTDGDGFNDGDEVKNGFSPTGAGTLTTPAPSAT